MNTDDKFDRFRILCNESLNLSLSEDTNTERIRCIHSIATYLYFKTRNMNDINDYEFIISSIKTLYKIHINIEFNFNIIDLIEINKPLLIINNLTSEYHASDTSVILSCLWFLYKEINGYVIA